MLKSLTLISLLFPVFAQAHNCTKFFDTDWRADEGYACEVTREDLEFQKLHRMEVCVASVPYRDGLRYAHAEYKWIDLDQYNNPFSKAEGLNEKYFNNFYSGISYAAYDGSDDERSYYDYEDRLEVRTRNDGSSFLKEHDQRVAIYIDKESGRGRLTTFNRKSAAIFKSSWKKSWDVQLDCKRVR